ncbi:MAG: glutamate--tRNA ligase [Patescibacteria group bacterium]|jgi:nondiscriminating glutamyl-tRNA synthetase
MSNKIRLRFAPSPTGFVHLGNLHTALFDFLAAKSMGGKLILRIEDTDQERKVEGAVEKMIEVLAWAGITFDEGPYTQTERLEIYQKYIKELLNKGEAYYCFCSKERLDNLREEQQAKKMPPRYDRACRNLSHEEAEKRIALGEKFVIRQKMPLEGEVVVRDELRGDTKFPAIDLDDHILIKSDGIPTYHFASVVDDHLMEISHVLRGSEWLPSLPKNILLYQSFGWTPPRFYHLPLMHNKEGGKLSKRKGDAFVEDFRAKGYLPEALVNFLALLGWHPEGEKEILSIAEIIKEFKLKNIGISPAIFDIDKLDYFNGMYIRQRPLPELLELCQPFLAENLALTTSDYKKSNEFLIKVVSLARERLKNLSEIGGLTKYFFCDNLEYKTELLVWRKSNAEGAKASLSDLKNYLTEFSEEDWNLKNLEEKVVAWLKDNEKGVGDYLWPLRVALTGEQASPSPFEMADTLGKTETLEKINLAINKL